MTRSGAGIVSERVRAPRKRFRLPTVSREALPVPASVPRTCELCRQPLPKGKRKYCCAECMLEFEIIAGQLGRARAPADLSAPHPSAQAR